MTRHDFLLAASTLSVRTAPNAIVKAGPMKRIWKEVDLLKAGVDGKFILDSDPTNLDQSSEVPIGFSRSERQYSTIIKGRILPTTYPYNL
ncbi:unnamed protein product, partial [Rotaria sp. Silwood1]